MYYDSFSSPESGLPQGLFAPFFAAGHPISYPKGQIVYIQGQEPEYLYIVGTGSTTARLMNYMGKPNTLLGVDLLFRGQVIGSDCTEQDILAALKKYPRAKIIVTVIGGQGYIFGRGNQQISAEVIRRVGTKNIMVIASRDKIFSLGGNPLLIDTGDEEVNRMLTGYIPVTTGYKDVIMANVIY